MSSLLARIGAWFIEPPPPAEGTPPPNGHAVPDGAAEPEPDADAAPPPLVAPNAATDTAAATAAAAASPTAAESPATKPSTRFLPPSAAVARAAAMAHPTARHASPTAAPARPTATGQPAPRFAPPRATQAASPGSVSSTSVTAPRAPAAPESADHTHGSAPSALERAAVLGAPAQAVPVAAACAGELRARAKASAALLCIWQPVPRAQAADPPDAAQSSAEPSAGATTPGARRLATRLHAHDLPAAACGRLAWLALEREPAAAAEQFRRCAAICAVPVVLAVAGARPPEFEPLLVDVDLAIAVLPADVEPALRDLALVTLRARERAVLPPLPPGPPRWAAIAGLARLRSLPRGGA